VRSVRFAESALRLQPQSGERMQPMAQAMGKTGKLRSPSGAKDRLARQSRADADQLRPSPKTERGARRTRP